MTITNRVGMSRNLTPAEVDGNFKDLNDRLTALAATGVGGAGPMGPAGPAGTAGGTGVAGAAGTAGVAGQAGVAGAQGIQGVIGATGLQGIPGTASAQGAIGLTGLTGLTGATGLPGTQGVPGNPGTTGIAGATGPTGAVGATGPSGHSGTYRGDVANQAAMLAVSVAVVGDWVRRIDLANQTFVLVTAGPATLANWTAEPVTAAAVAVRVAETPQIPLNIINAGTAMPLVAGQFVNVSADYTPVASTVGAVLDGVCVVDYKSTGTGNLVLTGWHFSGDPWVAEANRAYTATYYKQASGLFAVVQKGDLQAAAATAPGQVTALTLGTPTSTTQPLTWAAPASTGGSAITDYLIEAKATANAVWAAVTHTASTALAFTVTGLGASTPMDYRVSAVNVIGTGLASAIVSGSTTSGAATLALDSVTTAALGAYSLNRKLRSAYVGSACVIRSSTGVNITVGFSGNTVDWATAMTTLGANNAFLVTVFDQSANARDATQADTGKQPQIATAGVVNKQGSLYPASIGGTNTGLATAGFTLGATLGGATIYGAAGLLASAGTYGFACLLAGADAQDYASNNSLFVSIDASLRVHSDAGGSASGEFATVISAATVVTCSQYVTGNVANIWINGTAGSGAGTAIGAVGTAGAGNRLSFHGRIQDGLVMQSSAGNVMEVIYFPPLINADRLTVENNLRTAYGV